MLRLPHLTSTFFVFLFLLQSHYIFILFFICFFFCIFISYRWKKSFLSIPLYRTFNTIIYWCFHLFSCIFYCADESSFSLVINSAYFLLFTFITPRLTLYIILAKQWIGSVTTVYRVHFYFGWNSHKFLHSLDFLFGWSCLKLNIFSSESLLIDIKIKWTEFSFHGFIFYKSLVT